MIKAITQLIKRRKEKKRKKDIQYLQHNSSIWNSPYLWADMHLKLLSQRTDQEADRIYTIKKSVVANKPLMLVDTEAYKRRIAKEIAEALVKEDAIAFDMVEEKVGDDSVTVVTGQLQYKNSHPNYLIY